MTTSLSTILVRAGGLAAASALLFGLTEPAAAATRTWQPQATLNWSNPNNWAEGVAPVNGDDLVFPTFTSATVVNDIPDLHVRSINVGGNYTITGQPFFIGTGGFSGVPDDTRLITLDVDVTLDADSNWNGNGVFVIANGQVRLNGHRLIFSGRGGTRFAGPITGAGTLDLTNFGGVDLIGESTYTGRTLIGAGIVSLTHSNGLGAGGSVENGTFVGGENASSITRLGVYGGITIPEYITLALPSSPDHVALYVESLNPTFTGPIELVGAQKIRCTTGGLTFANRVFGGSMEIFADRLKSPAPEGCVITLASGDNSFSGLTLGYQIDFKVTAPNALPSTKVVNNGKSFWVEANPVTIDSISGTGRLRVGEESAARLQFQGTGQAVFNGPIGGHGVIAFGGSVHQTFTNATHTFGGTFEVGSGSLTLTRSIGATKTTVASGGRFGLKETGGVSGEVEVVSGTFLIGEAGAATVSSGPLDLQSGAATVVGGSLPASLAMLAVTGPVELDGTLSLALPEGFAPTVGQEFVIIQNDAADAVDGTFDGLPESATFSSRGVTFAISYVGGTGNDVVLTVGSVVREYFLSEGATGTFFSTEILLANPNPAPAPVELTFLKSDGTTVTRNETLPANSHRTLRAASVTGLEATAFSTIVRSTDALPLIVERTMTWDETGYGSHMERAVDGPARTWYFAEGAQGFFFTYVLLSNPQPAANSATVTYLIEGDAPIVRTYPLAPSSRFTVDIGADQALRDRSFGMTVAFDQPGIAERAMYFGLSPLWLAGHESAGVIAPSTSWFLAEGATGSYFETFVLLANPNDRPVTATLTYLPAAGAPVVRTKSIPANGRVTINVEFEDATLASAAVATSVTAPLPIIVERSQYWPDPASQWFEAHNSFGLTATATRWGLAEGRVGGSRNAQTYILLANPGTVAAQVNISILREDGAPLPLSVKVEPQSRYNVALPGDVPALINENFGALIQSDQPIAVERALYWDANGVTWAAGSNATGTPLPLAPPPQ